MSGDDLFFAPHVDFSGYALGRVYNEGMNHSDTKNSRPLKIHNLGRPDYIGQRPGKATYGVHGNRMLISRHATRQAAKVAAELETQKRGYLCVVQFFDRYRWLSPEQSDQDFVFTAPQRGAR